MGGSVVFVLGRAPFPCWLAEPCYTLCSSAVLSHHIHANIFCLKVHACVKGPLVALRSTRSCETSCTVSLRSRILDQCTHCEGIGPTKSELALLQSSYSQRTTSDSEPTQPGYETDYFSEGGCYQPQANACAAQLPETSALRATPKIAQKLDGLTSWFENGGRIDDW